MKKELLVDQVTGGLENLQDITETRSRSVEEINAEIERLTEETNRKLEAINLRITKVIREKECQRK